MKISVCIPTYGRPELLRKAIASLEEQARLPDELLIVWRNGDFETGQVARTAGEKCRLRVTSLTVSEPGFLPPIRAAINCAESDVLAFIDDDAAAFPDWLARMEGHYRDAAVGGVGGRVVTMFDGVMADYPPAKIIGRLDYVGRSFGNMYREPTRPGIRSVDFVAGGNMSYRTSILKKIGIEPLLNNNVALNWELDLGLSVKEAGYEIVYDPDMKVFHYTGPRAQTGMRSPNREGIYWHNFNYAYIMAKHLPYHRLLLFMAYRLLVGATDSPGMLNFVGNTMLRRRTEWMKLAPTALAGWISGLTSYFRAHCVYRS
jgi:GT2 family glycosyltransferase